MTEQSADEESESRRLRRTLEVVRLCLEIVKLLGQVLTMPPW